MGRAKAAAGTSRARMSNIEAPTNDDPNKRPITGTWDGVDTKMLATLKHIDVKPKVVAAGSSLQVLGLYNDVVTIFQTLGMGRYWEKAENIHPKLVKEFIATCRLTYTDPANPKASQGKITFFLNRKHYSKTLFEICDMYGFTKGEAAQFPKLSSEVADDFWNTIATGPYQSRKAKISHIRSPVVRYVAKVLDSVLHFKPVIAAVTETELPILFYGVKHLLPAYSDLPAPDTK